MDKSDLLKELRIDKEHRTDRSVRWPWIALLLTVVLISITAGVWFFFVESAKAFDVEAAAAIAPNTSRADTSVLQATGYVTARRQATVSAQITGTLTEVLIEEGDHVKRGQVLARLDDRQYKATLGVAIDQAKAAHALVDQYRAQLEQNNRDAARNATLAKQGLVPRQTAEQAQTLVSSTRAQLSSQQKQALAADANAIAAQVNFDYCVVRAPFDGVITTKDAQIGEIVSPFSAGGGFTRTGIGTIVDMDSLELDVDVNEAYIGRVTPNMPAETTPDAYPDWKIPSHVIAIVPTADRGKGTVKVRIGIDAKDPRILPDMGARVSFFEAASKTVNMIVPKGVLVPVSAVVKRDGKDTVFAIDGDRARAEPVTQGQIYNDMRLIDGMAAGTLVIKQPPVEMADGAKIKVKSGK